MKPTEKIVCSMCVMDCSTCNCECRKEKDVSFLYREEFEDWGREVLAAYAEYESEGTFIKAERHGDLYIVHGEINIVCLDNEYNILWVFSARDIFVTQDNSSAFEMAPEGIYLKDWLGYSYLIGYDGKIIQETLLR